MENRYKLLVLNQNLYKEIELTSDTQTIRIGTGVECDIRLYKDLFFEQIEILLTCNDGEWAVSCSDNLYLSVGDARKLMTKKLAHGDVVTVRYQEGANDVFKMEFLIDFDNGRQQYNSYVDVAACSGIMIGANAGADIVIRGKYIRQDDFIELSGTQEFLLLKRMDCKYGVYHNGKRAQAGEKIHNGDFFSIADHFFYYKDGKIWTDSKEKAVADRLKLTQLNISGNYPKFIRNTRIKTVIGGEAIEILDPPSKPQMPKKNIFMQLLPSLGMLIAAGVMAAMGGGMMLMFSGVSAVMSVVTAILNIREGKKDYEKNATDRISKYSQYIDDKRSEIERIRQEEKKALEDIYISQTKEKQMLHTFSPDLFDRQETDDDFLCVMLGTGAVKAKRTINYKKQERMEFEDELQQMPEKLSSQYRDIPDSPVYCDFKAVNAVGIVGEEQDRFEIFKNMVIDLAARHYYTDVKMFFVAESGHADKIKWLRFLPHACDMTTGARSIVCDDESKNLIFEYLYKELTEREQDKKTFPRIVVFFYDEYGFKSHPISKFTDKAKELGVTFVFFGNAKSDIPMGCGFLLIAGGQNSAELINAADKNDSHGFTYVPGTDKEMQELVSLLAPVYTEEISLEGSLTKNISLFELLNVIAADDIDLKSRWENSKVYNSMAAPLGVSKTGVVMLDLHDKAHGPHGLVAGTTGSGKSEILQTYILMMSTLFHPYEIGFLIIDFKGGGMVNQFKRLPHLLGAITNIDGKEIDRSLKSIKAELQKRQRLFAEADVNHIDKYIRKYKAGETEIPLPHLIIIVDEFAELRAEQPEFMKELISAARIGRSLGVHLILATQKPAGQVDEQIWSNSRFKLCLKVQSREDSNEVLKSPLAAEIKEPGRAYFQVGNNEIFELFQSAYSGAPEKIDDSRVREFSIFEVSESGKKKPVYVQKKNRTGEGSLTQLDALVEYVAGYCEQEHIAALDNICLPPLPDVIKWTENCFAEGGLADIGIYDDPDNQVQPGAKVDFANKNTLIIGSAQYGKTNLLQLIIRSIAVQTGPGQSVFYILDFASMVLKNFEKLHHVGGVVTSSEDEKLKNLFKLLFDEINSRKEKLLAVGVSSYSSYLEAGYTDLPHIYLIIDNFTALSDLYFQDDDSLLLIIREGISLGISAVVANAQVAGIGYKYISNFANRIALYCNDSTEYANVFDYASVKPDEKAGRCILELDKRIFECQTYLAFDGVKEFERVQQMHRFIDGMNEKYADARAKQIPCIPKVLTRSSLYDDFGAVCESYAVPIGLTYKEVEPYYLNLYQIGIFGVTGKERFGHKNFISYLLDTLADKKANIVIFDDVTRKYSEYKDRADLYTLSAEPAVDVIKDWGGRLEKRYNQMLADASGEPDTELLLMVIQNNDVAARIQSDFEASDMFDAIVSKYKDLGVCIIFANYANKAVPFDAPEPIRIVRQNQTVLCLEDLQNLKCFDPPYDAVRENKKPLAVGDGYFINDNEVTKIKIVSAGR